MYSVTGGRPKELLDLGGRTVLARIVHEARCAGATEVLVVSSPAKAELSHHAKDLGCVVVDQLEPNGLGPAVALALPATDSMLLLGDTVYRGVSPLEALGRQFALGYDGVLAVEPVDDSQLSAYGIVECAFDRQVTRILEKPNVSDTSSREAIAARYIFSARFFHLVIQRMGQFLRESGRPEVSLTPAMQAAIDAGMDFRSVPLAQGAQRVDCGSVEDYLRAKELTW